MFPLAGDDGLDGVREHLEVDEVTAAALTDPARPIVLARSKSGFSRDPIPGTGSIAAFAAPTGGLSPHLAPGLNELGAFLPYSPLHHELLRQFGRPIVATSGNVSGEPVITDNGECQQRLAGVADVFPAPRPPHRAPGR